MLEEQRRRTTKFGLRLVNKLYTYMDPEQPELVEPEPEPELEPEQVPEPKKRGRPKKEPAKEPKEPKEPKPRGRPKKEPAKEPKPRGRPKEPERREPELREPRELERVYEDPMEHLAMLLHQHTEDAKMRRREQMRNFLGF